MIIEIKFYYHFQYIKFTANVEKESLYKFITIVLYKTHKILVKILNVKTKLTK